MLETMIKLSKQVRSGFKYLQEQHISRLQFLIPYYIPQHRKNITNINNIQQFDLKVKSAKKKVMVNFYEGWRLESMSATHYLEAAAEQTGKYEYLRVNMDGRQTAFITHRFKVQNSPTVIILQKGKEVRRLTDHITREQAQQLFK